MSNRKTLREIIATCIMCGNPIYGLKETTEENPEVKRTCFCVPLASIYYYYPQPLTPYYNPYVTTYTLPYNIPNTLNYLTGTSACASQ